jgi:hypothetical protein
MTLDVFLFFFSRLAAAIGHGLPADDPERSCGNEVDVDEAFKFLKD